METPVSNDFWAGGSESYRKTLQEEEAQAIEPLKESLRVESDSKIKRSLKDQIKAIQAEFKQKRRSAGASLFMGT